MTRAERLAALLEQLVSDGRLDVDEAADRHGVSPATVRRDLDYLADQQLLSRTHGGAVPNTTSYDLPLRFKATSRGEAKQRIARRAVEMLWPGCTCALNGGTTTVEIARAIPGVQALHDGVTVVTNAVNIATELTVRPFIKIVVSGGVARPQTYELVGPIASETLGRLTPDLCFLGATGVDVTAGVTSDDEGEAAVNRVMVSQAKRTIVVADSVKLGRIGFARICDLTDVAGVLTDAGAAPETLDAIRAMGLEVLIA
jgi:DeoR family transcriptional regulator, aga operon transcriptional repressor